MSHFSSRGFSRTCTYVCAQCRLKQTARHVSRARFHTSRRQAGAAEQSVLSLLEERGYINQIAGDRNVLDRALRSRSVGFYAGIDPTAPSLHLGHLLPLMVLFWLHRHGHHVVSLVGGATSRVGDPSGRLTSRAATAEAVLEANFHAMHAQIGALWTSARRYGEKYGDRRGTLADGTVELLNNAEWLDGLNVLQFLKTMGNGMRLGALLGRDTVKNKMEKGDGMSFSEFTYPLLQAWDWWQMYQERGVQVQVGGSDQYGNLIAGIDAVKYIAQTQTHTLSRDGWLDRSGKLQEDFYPMGLTVPLLTTSSGEKFGKSAGNAVWLDRQLTSPFDLYGVDDDVERYLKLFTFIPLPDIVSVMREHTVDPGKRKAQHLLAGEVLELVHGPEEAVKTRGEHQAMRAPTLSSLSRTVPGQHQQQTSKEVSTGVQRVRLPKSLVYDTPFARILYHAGIVASKSEGTRLISKGGAYMALASPSSDLDADGEMKFVPIQEQQRFELSDGVVDGFLVLRAGKWKVRVIEVVEDSEFDASGLDAPGWVAWKAAAAAVQ